MKLKVPEVVKKAKTYDLCQREDLGISQVVKERKELLEMMKNPNWAPHVVEQFNLRMKYLDSRIVEEYLKK